MQPTKKLHGSPQLPNTQTSKRDAQYSSPKTVRCTSGSRRMRWYGLLLIFHFSFFSVQSCGLDVEDPTPPPPPEWVQKSLPEEWPERGIDAHESGGICLEWRAATDDYIAAYLIYRAEYYNETDSLGEFDLISRIEKTLSEDGRYVDANVLARTEYFYKMRVEDSSGNMSGFSDSSGYTLFPSIDINTMEPNNRNVALATDRRLRWTYGYGVEMEDYTITLLTEFNDLVLRDRFSPSNYVNGIEAWMIPDSIELLADNIYKWRVDTGAKYDNGLEFCGSESPWAKFIYQND